jgi:hypothetical protein
MFQSKDDIEVRRPQQQLWTWLIPICLALSIVSLIFFTLSQPVHASGPITVCNETNLDTALASGGSITFNCNGTNDSATIVVSNRKTVLLPTSIDGGGVITLSGGGVTGILSVPIGLQLTLTNISLINGYAFNENGGAVDSEGILNVSQALFYNNVTTGTQPLVSRLMSGGAIRSAGPLTVTDSKFVRNLSNVDGAAIYIPDTALPVPVFISATVFYSNTSAEGGAVENDGGDPTFIINSIFHDNRAIYVAGALYSTAGAVYSDHSPRLIIEGSVFYHNTAPVVGGLYNYGVLTMTNSSIFNNISTSGSNGGASLSGNSVLSNVAIYNNSAPYGRAGGIRLGAQSFLYNTTIAGNSAAAAGGLFVTANTLVVTLTNVTLFGNTAINASGNISGPVAVINTIIANGSPNNCSKPIASLGHNLDSSNSCGLHAMGDITNQNPLLYPLANYGGSTPSMLPLPGSPVIDHGDDAACPAIDQRGVARPVGAHCDIGAVEFDLMVHSIYLPLSLKNF